MISLPPAVWEYWQHHQQSFIIMGVLGVATAVVVSYWRRRNTMGVEKRFASSSSKSLRDCKLVILVRTDVNMGKGKAAAQCCHAVLETYKQAVSRHPSLLGAWEADGQPKITLKVDSESELDELVRQARQSGLPAASIRDAGRTQVAAGTKTVAAIGPGPAKMIDLITGHLKLY